MVSGWYFFNKYRRESNKIVLFLIIVVGIGLLWGYIDKRKQKTKEENVNQIPFDSTLKRDTIGIFK